MLCLTEEVLVGQHQRVDVCAHARTAHNGLLQKKSKKTGRGSLLNGLACPPKRPVSKGIELNSTKPHLTVVCEKSVNRGIIYGHDQSLDVFHRIG